MLYNFCEISFEKDSVTYEYYTRASCTPKEREKLYEHSLSEKYTFDTEKDKVYIHNSKRDSLIIEGNYITGTVNLKTFTITNKKFVKIHDISSFKQKIDFVSNLLKEQPSMALLQLANRKNYFQLDSVYKNALYYSHTKGDYITVYFNDTNKIRSIAFEENKDKQKEIANYLTETIKFKYFASEHLCDYYNKEGINVCFCPTENRLKFSVSEFNR